MTTTPARPGAAARSRLEPEPMPRRDFLGLSAVGSALVALLFGLFGAARLPRAAVVPVPSRKFRVSLPETLPPGEAFVPAGRSVAIFRDSDGVYAISRTCTHLGCLVKVDPDGFHCPCHGSVFDQSGVVVSGPAPSPLAWFLLTLSRDGHVVIDTSQQVKPDKYLVV